ELDRFLALALRAREQKISTLGLVPPAIDTTNPDYRKIHDKVAAAVGRAETRRPSRDSSPEPVREAAGESERGTEASRPSAADGVVTGASLGSRRAGYAANQAEDLGASC
ncbi:MAG: LCP family protein, partial [Nocardioides sp.]